MENLTAKNLKNILWETLNNVKDGKIDAGHADSVATQAREIIRLTNTQLKIAQQAKREIPADILLFSETN